MAYIMYLLYPVNHVGPIVSGRSVPRQTERAADSDLGMTGGHEAEASRPFWNWSSISLEPGPGLLLASTHNNATTAGPNCSGGTVT